MRWAAFASAILLAGCASTVEMAQAPPFRTYSSAKPRSAIADCLLDRVSSFELRPSRSDQAGVTTVAFEADDSMLRPRPAIYVFTIHDAPGGSSVEARRLGRASLAAAETCF